MLGAARDLLVAHGPTAVTHLRVAAAAGVARATVYRHWPDRADILHDLLRQGADFDLTLLPVGLPIVDRVSEILRMFATALNRDIGQIMAVMIGLAGWDEDVFVALERMAAFGPKLLQDLLTAGIEEGSLTPGVDINMLSDQLLGPPFIRRLLFRKETTDAYVDRLVANTLGPYLTG